MRIFIHKEELCSLYAALLCFSCYFGRSSFFWANKFNEFLNALGGLFDYPVVSVTNDQRCHLDVGPIKREIVAVKCPCHHFAVEQSSESCASCNSIAYPDLAKDIRRRLFGYP